MRRTCCILSITPGLPGSEVTRPRSLVAPWGPADDGKRVYEMDVVWGTRRVIYRGRESEGGRGLAIAPEPRLADDGKRF